MAANSAPSSTSPTPPGLDCQEGLFAMGSSPQQQHTLLTAVSEVILQEVDSRITLREEELWARAKQLFQQMQLKHNERMAGLVGEVARCQQNYQALEVENTRLKQDLAALLQRFCRLGEIFSGSEAVAAAAAAAAATHGGEGAAAAAVAAPGSPTLAAKAVQAVPASPQWDADATAEAGAPTGAQHKAMSEAVLPEFPASFKLAEALGCNLTPHTRTTLSLERMVSPSCSPEGGAPELVPPALIGTQMGAFAGMPIGPSRQFSFQLRKADGADLGLNVTSGGAEQVLRVEGIRAGGAVDSWNRQCTGGHLSDKTVIVGDKITSINGVSCDTVKMLQECKDKHLLKITIVRGEPPALAPVTLPAATPSSSTANKMRADASVFVPTSASAGA